MSLASEWLPFLSDPVWVVETTKTLMRIAGSRGVAKIALIDGDACLTRWSALELTQGWMHWVLFPQHDSRPTGVRHRSDRLVDHRALGACQDALGPLCRGGCSLFKNGRGGRHLHMV